MESLAEAVDCVLEGMARTEPCSYGWARTSMQEFPNPVEEPKVYAKLVDAEKTCIEGALWLGASVLGYSYTEARYMCWFVNQVFMKNYACSIRAANDWASNWTEDSNGRDVALAKLKDLL